MVELLKQPQYEPMDAIDEVIQIFAGGKGYLDDLSKEDIPKFAGDLVAYFAGPGIAMRDELAAAQAISKELGEKMDQAIAAFKGTWGSGSETASTEEAPAETAAE